MIYLALAVIFGVGILTIKFGFWTIFGAMVLMGGCAAVIAVVIIIAAAGDPEEVKREEKKWKN